MPALLTIPSRFRSLNWPFLSLTTWTRWAGRSRARRRWGPWRGTGHSGPRGQRRTPTSFMGPCPPGRPCRPSTSATPMAMATAMATRSPTSSSRRRTTAQGRLPFTADRDRGTPRNELSWSRDANWRRHLAGAPTTKEVKWRIWETLTLSASGSTYAKAQVKWITKRAFKISRAGFH